MMGLIEMVERLEEKPVFAGRAYRYGSRVRLFSGDTVTVIDCGYEAGEPVFDYVDFKGAKGWTWDSCIVEVVAL